MKLRKFYTLNGDVYEVTLYTEDWSQLDQQLIIKFGEPEINVGGIFSHAPSFSMPDDFAKVMTESPFNQGFDARDYTHAEQYASQWAEQVSDRIADAIIDLRTNNDDFTKEVVQNV